MDVTAIEQDPRGTSELCSCVYLQEKLCSTWKPEYSFKNTCKEKSLGAVGSDL